VTRFVGAYALRVTKARDLGHEIRELKPDEVLQATDKAFSEELEEPKTYAARIHYAA
jgi:hypothetical protein